MSTPTPTSLPTGAYIIRNRANSTVVHNQVPDATHQGTYSVQASQQDEGQFTDQQIWWIEPLANYDHDSAKGFIYSITTPGSGKALEGSPESGWAYSNKACGAPWQRWRFDKVTDPETDEVSYIIINVLNDRALDIHGLNPSPGAWVNVQPFSPDRAQHRWEFTVPLVGFPPGWFHMHLVGTSQLLSHDYDHNAPALMAPPSPMLESHHRQQWAFQWTLCHSKCYMPATASERNSWFIINRQTRAPLSPFSDWMTEADFAGQDDNLAWRLELDMDCNWKITNRATSCLLQKAPGTASGAVCCTHRKFIQAGGHQSWVLRPPPCHSGEDAPPPDYQSSQI